MARPAKNTVDYFPFICSEGKKMYYLEETYGNDGFATFLKILRELANTEYHYLDLSKNTTKMFLSAKCKVPKETLENIIKDLVELEKFDKDLWENFEVIWCQDFVNSIQDAYKKRSNECITRNGLRELLEGLRNPKQGKGESEEPVKPQTILEDTKEEERRENAGAKMPLPSSAYDLLKSEKLKELNIFEMQNKNQVKKWKDLIDKFNDTIEIEINQGRIDFEAEQLFPRLRKYTRSWINNQDKYKSKDQDNYSLKNIPIG